MGETWTLPVTATHALPFLNDDGDAETSIIARQEDPPQGSIVCVSLHATRRLPRAHKKCRCVMGMYGALISIATYNTTTVYFSQVAASVASQMCCQSFFSLLGV